MKRIILALAGLLSAALAFAFDATVVSTKGKVEILRGSDWQPLEAGASVSKGDVIQTGFKSEVILQIKESVVTMDALSRLTVEQLAEKETQDETRLFLDTGSLKSNVQKSENRRVGFTVRSPVATASVRGTMLTVTNTYGGTSVTTHRGRVAVWKTRLPEALVTTDEEDSAPEAATGEGSGAQDIAATAPRGAITVAAGQTSGVAVAEAAPSAPKATAATTTAPSSTVSQTAAETVAPVSAQAASSVTVSEQTAGTQTGTAASQAAPHAATGRVIIPISIK